FASGPALLILLCLVIRSVTFFDPGKKAIQSLAVIATYGLVANLFFMICEVFVVFYSNIPSHKAHFIYLYAGLYGKTGLVPWMWTSVVLMVTAACLLLIPGFRKNETILGFACVALFAGTWIDKGMGMISGGFVPSPLHHVTEYSPSMHELIISAGVTALGLFILTLLYKIVLSVKLYNHPGNRTLNT
ncbi:MAG: menaquinol oxidoreductase, partial [Desulfobacterales bacterium]|nr:menaquinol oxidoreductase [Desulfobacterales bacterium]